MTAETELPPVIESVRFWSVMRQNWETTEVHLLSDEDLATSFLEPERTTLAAKRSATWRAIRAYWGTRY